MEKKGSSETIRETLLKKNITLKPSVDLIGETTLFDFSSYIQNGTPDHKPKPAEDFLQWFIGFFEAEGSFTHWSDNGRQIFQIEISQKDPALMYKIRTQLGFGNVTSFECRISQTKKTEKITYWKYHVSSAKHLNRLILLFNGNLITFKKQEQLKLWVEKMNHVYQTSYDIFHRKLIISLKTAWLAGFLEGNGGFWASPNNLVYKAKDSSLSYRIRMKFYITQKGEGKLLNQIQTLFQIPTCVYQIPNGHSTEKSNRLETNVLSCHQDIMDYLTGYPFLGQRNILIQRWGRLIGYRTKKYPITEKSIKKLKRLIQSTKNN